MAASTKQPFAVEDFSGGLTDNNFSGDMRTAAVVDNFVITPDKKLLTRPGSDLDNAVNSPLPLGNQRIGRLINYARNDQLFAQSGRQFYYRDQTGAYVNLLGAGNNPILSDGTVNNFVSTSEWNRQTFIVSDAFSKPVKIYKNQAGQYKAQTVGMPALSTPPTVTPGAMGTRSYIYGFVYIYQYTVGTQTLIEQGPVTWVTNTQSGDPSANPNLISNIPVVSNGSTDNYDTANITVQIYRSPNNLSNLYLIGTVPNGTTTFSDNVSDTVAQNNVALYTNDGTLDYLQAPKSKYVHIVGNVGFYGYTQDATGMHPYRVHQSVPGNPGFVPEITYVELEDEVKGLASVKSLPIALCKRIIYRLDGTFQSSGAGNVNPVKIHNSAGCISSESAVEAENYVFWAGNDGFYASDGYQVIKISDHLNQTYQRMLRAAKDVLRIQGRFDEINRRVYWSVQLNAQSLENDTLFVLDLRGGVTPNSTFTTWSGNSFRPSAIEVFNGQLYRGDNNGFVFRHDSSFDTDPRVDISKVATSWARETILWNYTSNQINFGSSFFRKFVSRILIQAENLANTSIQVTASNDQGRKTRQLKPIRWKRNVTWDDEAVTWGSPDCVWNAQGLIEQWRRFPAHGLRLSYLQLSFKNAFSIVRTSAADGRCLIDRTGKTAILTNLWPSQSSDYTLYTSADNFVRGFKVLMVNGSKDTLVLSDPQGNLPPSGTYDWQLYGNEKGEPLNLLSYTLHWDNVDQNQATFHAGDSGAAS